MLNSQKEQKKKMAKKNQNFKFHYSFNNFGTNPPQEYSWIRGNKSDVLLQRCHLKLLLPYGPMLTKMKKKKKKIAKIQNLKFHNSLNNFDIFEIEPDVCFQMRCRLKFVLS